MKRIIYQYEFKARKYISAKNPNLEGCAKLLQSRRPIISSSKILIEAKCIMMATSDCFDMFQYHATSVQNLETCIGSTKNGSITRIIESDGKNATLKIQ